MADKNDDVDIEINEEAYEAIEEAAEKSTGHYELKLRKPFTFEDRTFESLTFEFDAMTGKDGLAIERELRRKNINVIIPAYDGEYIARYAARSCTDKIGLDVIEALPHSEWSKIRYAAASFLMRSAI